MKATFKPDMYLRGESCTKEPVATFEQQQYKETDTLGVTPILSEYSRCTIRDDEDLVVVAM